MKRLIPCLWAFFCLSWAHAQPPSPVNLPQLADAVVKFADMDQDGDEDIFMIGSDSSGAPQAYLFERQSSGLSQLSHPFVALGNAAASWRDFNGDGYPDLFLTGSSGAYSQQSLIYQNTGSGFVLASQNPIGLIGAEGLTKDLDNDGDADLLFCGFSSNLGPVCIIWENQDSLQFVEHRSALPGFFQCSLDAADLNGDGYPEVLISGENQRQRLQTAIFEGGPGFSYDSIGHHLPPVHHGALRCSDQNRDGFPDLMLAGVTTGKSCRTFQGLGLQFSAQADTFPVLLHSDARWADFDGDGDEDLALCGNGTTGNFLYLYENQSSTLSLIGSPLLGLAFPHIAWGQLNGDAYLDLIVTGRDSTFQPATYQYLYNPSNQSFELQ